MSRILLNRRSKPSSGSERANRAEARNGAESNGQPKSRSGSRAALDAAVARSTAYGGAAGPPPSKEQALSFREAILGFVRRPDETLVRRWNWKAALTSSLIRGGIFFGVNATASLEAAAGAALTEIIVRGATSGFYGAVTQQLSLVRPSWHGAVGAMLLLPLFNHSLEFAAHWLRGTQKLWLSILASVIFTALSTLFHLFVMKRGVMIVGEGSQSLGADLAQMPKNVGLFVAQPFLWTWRGARALLRLARR